MTGQRNDDGIRGHIERLFRFLIEEYGFTGPKVEDRAWSLVATYRGPTVAVQITVDRRELDVDTELLWLKEGRVPEEFYERYEQDSDGDVRHISLYQLDPSYDPSQPLRANLAKRKGRKSPASALESVEQWLTRNADDLRKHGQQVLRGSTEIFKRATTARKTEMAWAETNREKRMMDAAISEAGHELKKGNFRRVAELLGPFADRLPPKQRRRLQHAREHA